MVFLEPSQQKETQKDALFYHAESYPPETIPDPMLPLKTGTASVKAGRRGEAAA